MSVSILCKLEYSKVTIPLCRVSTAQGMVIDFAKTWQRSSFWAVDFESEIQKIFRQGFGVQKFSENWQNLGLDVKF